MKVVIDTNVLVSALLKPGGLEASVMFAVARGSLAWCVSKPILEEYSDVLHRTKFNRIPTALIVKILSLASQAEFIETQVNLSHSPDESDNRFYECAAASRADYIITGNLKHFPRPLPGTKIVNARQLLDDLNLS
jgi:putative PIN family toxin of toxin-antitoxin system